MADIPVREVFLVDVHTAVHVFFKCYLYYNLEFVKTFSCFNIVILIVRAIAVRTVTHMIINSMMERRAKMKTAVQSIAQVPQHPQIRRKENTVTAVTVSSSAMAE